MQRSSLGVSRWGLVLTGLLLGGAERAPAQIPETFTNLRVLPKDIKRAELVAAMRGMASGLGVRCTHCHVGPDNLQGMSFASDEKPTKRAAREMMKMVQTINSQFLAALPAREDRQTVGCYTCHRGQPEPPPALHVVLGKVAEHRGAVAAVEEFRKLKAEHLAAGTYDFRDRTLVRVGTALLEAGKLDDAVVVLKASLESFPDSAATHQALGQVYMKKGDTPAAVEHLSRALALNPNDPFAKEALDDAKAKLAKP